MSRTDMVLAILIPLCFTISFASGQQGKAEPAGVAAARARQEAVKTANIEFKVTETWARGALTQMGYGPEKLTRTVPEQETTVESVNRIVLDGEKAGGVLSVLNDCHALSRTPAAA